MIEQATMDLIQRALDGEITLEESASLQQLMDQNSEARAFYAESLRVVQQLSETPPVPAPATLKTTVLQAIREESQALAAPASEVEGLWTTLKRLIHGQSAVRYGYAFMGGAVVCALVIGLSSNGFRSLGLDESGLSGSLAPVPETDHRVARTLAMPGVEGQVEVVFGHEQVSTVLHLATREAVDVRVWFLQSEAPPVSFSQETPQVTDLAFSPGLAGFQHTGKNTYHLVANGKSPDAAALRIEISLGGQTQTWTIARGTD